MTPLQRVIATGGVVLSLLLLVGGAVATVPQPPPSSAGLNFDGTVTLGNLLTLAGMLLALIAGYSRIMARIEIIESRVHDLWDDYKDRRRRRLGEDDA